MRTSGVMARQPARCCAAGGSAARSARPSAARFGLGLGAMQRGQTHRRDVAAFAGAEKAPEKAEKAPWTAPKLDPTTPSPIFGGSTGGLLRKAQVEEFYVITWDSKKEQIFEMPTGGAAIMRKGPNLLKLARKEQCMALLTQLRSKFKLNGCYYRVFPNGEVQYLHPKDGVYPEKVNPGRQQSNTNDRRIGQNVDPINVKFTGSLGPFDSSKSK